MAHFRGTIQGNRGEASRLGSRAGGLQVTCNGWHDGIKVVAAVINDRDVFEVYSNGGSNGDGLQLYIGMVVNGKFVKGDKPK